MMWRLAVPPSEPELGSNLMTPAGLAPLHGLLHTCVGENACQWTLADVDARLEKMVVTVAAGTAWCAAAIER